MGVGSIVRGIGEQHVLEQEEEEERAEGEGRGSRKGRAPEGESLRRLGQEMEKADGQEESGGEGVAAADNEARARASPSQEGRQAPSGAGRQREQGEHQLELVQGHRETLARMLPADKRVARPYDVTTFRQPVGCKKRCPLPRLR